MARYKGTFAIASNYEPHIQGPFDARQLVETKRDLMSSATWLTPMGECWVYKGMMVVVSSDINPDNNGLYILTDLDYSLESNWQKQASHTDIQELQEQIENLEIEGGSLDVEVDTETELPPIGDENTTYYVKENQSIQRWDSETQSYVAYGGESGEAPDLEINLIHGGDSNGNS